MGHRPVRVTADVGAQPGIACRDAAVVHVVAQVRDHEGTAGSLVKPVAGKLVNGLLTEPGTLLKSAHGTCLRA